jgi:hypothetical protein
LKVCLLPCGLRLRSPTKINPNYLNCVLFNHSQDECFTMTTPSMIPVILAGGKGERFWPLSRRHRPKQFLCLDGSDRSLLQATADRLLAVAEGWESIWVVTASHLAAGVREQLPELPAENLLVEPEGRDTAPAVAWSTLEIAQRHGREAVLGFFPADHWIADQETFRSTLRAATELAATEPAIVTLGIAPTYAAQAMATFNRATKLECMASFRHIESNGLPKSPIALRQKGFWQRDTLAGTVGCLCFGQAQPWMSCSATPQRFWNRYKRWALLLMET